jgi:poly-beta-1,6-N-acetyl-D-glucosamine N-deacetylase
MGTSSPLSRRDFLTGGAAVAAGVAVSLSARTLWSSGGLSTPPRVRASAPDTAIDPALAKQLQAGHPFPAADLGELLVLSYHMVFPAWPLETGLPNPFSVTADQLLDHLLMLRGAGFRSVRLADVLAARQSGSRLPPRSVLITFDDGTSGQWIHADAVLRRTGFRAVAFLITGYLGGSSEFLSWSEVRAMAASRRWEIGDHTHRDHHTVPSGPSMVMQSALINRVWNPKTHAMETRAQAQARVSTDFETSLSVLHSHKLARPLAFAYPFSAVEGPTNDPVLSEYAEEVAASLFPLRFTNFSPGRLVGHADLVDGLLPRFEVHRSVSALELYERIRAASATTTVVLPAVDPRTQWLR